MLILCVIDTREFGLKIYFWRMYASLVGQSPFKVTDLPIIWPKASAQLSQARGHSDLTLKTYSFSRVKRWQMQEEIKNDVSLFKVSRPCEKPWSGLLFWAGLAMLREKSETKVRNSVYPKTTQIHNKWLEDTTMYMCCMLPWHFTYPLYSTPHHCTSLCFIFTD